MKKEKSIDEKIKELNSIERKFFEDTLLCYLYDRLWCKKYKINYNNPDVQKAKEILYESLYKRGIIGKKDCYKGRYIF